MKGFHQLTAKDWLNGMKCPYCGEQALWTSNEAIYGRPYGRSYMCYYCKDCDAYVGCHQNSRKPLGRMANKELRQWRIKAHEVIDAFWRGGSMSRKEVYEYLNKQFGYEVHIGDTQNVDQCKEIMKVMLQHSVSPH